jgi:hypothetical protein
LEYEGCVAGPASSFTIVAGEHDLSKNDGTEQTVDVNKVIVHPEYNDFDISNDICLLKLDSEIDLMADGARAIALPNAGQETTGRYFSLTKKLRGIDSALCNSILMIPFFVLRNR